MRKLDSGLADFLYFLYRVVVPIFNPIKFMRGLYGYLWFTRDLVNFKRKSRGTKLFSLNLYPVLQDKVDFTPFDAHYFYQQLWVFEKVLEDRPKVHMDVGSTYEMSGYISKITKSIFVDLRPIKADLENLEVVEGDILNLPFEDDSIPSLSCLHVVEHVGLGRYGDPIDPLGSAKACGELMRVLARGGKLYFSVPIGKSRVCFNAHRVFDPQTILDYFQGLALVEFSVVDDVGKFHADVSPLDYQMLSYGCGMFLFAKEF